MKKNFNITFEKIIELVLYQFKLHRKSDKILRSLNYMILILFIAFSVNSYGQFSDSSTTDLQNIPNQFYGKVEKKYSSIDKDLSRKSVKYLKKLQRQENRFVGKLGHFDSTATAKIAGGGRIMKIS